MHGLGKLLFLIVVFGSPISEALADTVPVTGARPKIKVGALTELTGPGAMYGAACQAGYKVATDLFSQQYPDVAENVEVIYGDHKRDQKTALSEFRRLASLDVWGVACNHSIVGVVINPLSKDLQIPLFGVMGHASFVNDNPYAIRVIPTPQEEGGGLARMAFNRGAKKAAILLLEDDYILAVGAAFEKQFKDLGGEIVYKDSLDESLVDFSSVATRIRAAKPDIVEMSLGFQQFGPAIKRLREQGVRQPLYSNYWLSYPQVIATAGKENVEDSVYITEQSDFPVFLEAYERLSPDLFRSGVVFRCYTALATALSVLGQHPELKNRQEYAAVLQNLHSVALPDRELTIESREVSFQPEFYVVKEGKSQLIR